MAKKCIPGVICIENMALFLLLVTLLIVMYFFYIHSNKQSHSSQSIIPSIDDKVILVNSTQNIPIQNDPVAHFNNPYNPPNKDITGMMKPAVPVNIQTRGVNSSYQQVGILTRNDGSDMILPLMGRKHMNGRDKWQFYTVSGSGNLNTRLPVSVNGKSCTSEYGCDDIYNGDVIYVEGYNDTFNVTMYENNSFNYIPI